MQDRNLNPTLDIQVELLRQTYRGRVYDGKIERTKPAWAIDLV
jgi:hypothetical protein